MCKNEGDPWKHTGTFRRLTDPLRLDGTPKQVLKVWVRDGQAIITEEHRQPDGTYTGEDPDSLYTQYQDEKLTRDDIATRSGLERTHEPSDITERIVFAHIALRKKGEDALASEYPDLAGFAGDLKELTTITEQWRRGVHVSFFPIPVNLTITE